MRFEDDAIVLIEWGKEEGQLDFVEFVEFLRDKKATQEPVVVEENGTMTEFPLRNIYFMFRKPFPDFDLTIQYLIDEKKKELGEFDWDYTYMNRFKKLGDGKFCVTDEDGKETIIRSK